MIEFTEGVRARNGVDARAPDDGDILACIFDGVIAVGADQSLSVLTVFDFIDGIDGYNGSVLLEFLRRRVFQRDGAARFILRHRNAHIIADRCDRRD